MDKSEHVLKWLNNPPSPVFDSSLIGELRKYSDDADKRSKVKRVYHNCLLSGKRGIAIRIQQKYPEFFPESDIVTAYAYYLHVARGLKQK